MRLIEQGDGLVSRKQRASFNSTVSSASEKPWEIVNEFIKEVFSYQGDAPSPILPALPLLEGLGQ